MTRRLSDSTEIKPKRRRDTDELYVRRADAELQIEKALLLEKPHIGASTGRGRDVIESLGRDFDRTYKERLAVIV